MSPNKLLVDIEGTTTSISFVHQTLFPFVLKSLEEYLNRNWNTQIMLDDIRLLREDALNEQRNKDLNLPLIPDSKDANDDEIKKAIISNIRYQMSIDRKSTSLKSIQGHIWYFGYENGDLIGQ